MRFQAYGKFTILVLRGNTTALGLDRFKQDVKPWLPAVVLVEFGINDCYIFEHAAISRVSVEEYTRNMQEIVRQIHHGNGTPVLVVNHTMTLQGGHKQGNGQTVQANIEHYQFVLRNVSEKWGVSMIDLPAMMDTRQVDMARFLSDDGVHLSDHGQTKYASTIFEAMSQLNLWEERETC